MNARLVATAVAVCAVSWWLTGQLRRYALARRLLDVPNARSSHSVATPRGGGMAIVVSTLAALLALGAWHDVRWADVAGLAGAGALVAAIGFLDDHRDIPPQWRLLGHFAAAAWLLVWLGGPAGLPPTLWQVAAAIYVVWLLNLTNFMDGIDGIAAVEVITVCGGAVLLAIVTGVNVAAVPLVLAAAALGFLVWNWPPARIFMGDAGSGFLGMMMAALSLQAANVALPLLWAWVILLAVFITDASVTLVRRALRGDRLHEAHRLHAYQHAAQRYGRHKPVTLAVAAVNVLWLLPLALLVATRHLSPLVGVTGAYLPLIAAAVLLGAGVPQPRRQPHASPSA